MKNGFIVLAIIFKTYESGAKSDQVSGITKDMPGLPKDQHLNIPDVSHQSVVVFKINNKLNKLRI